MELEVILLILVVELVNVLSFYLGASLVQKVKNDEKIELPKIKTPVELYREHEAKQEENEREKQLKADLETINNYTGDVN